VDAPEIVQYDGSAIVLAGVEHDVARARDQRRQRHALLDDSLLLLRAGEAL